SFLFMGIILFTGYHVYRTIKSNSRSHNLTSGTDAAGFADKQSLTRRKNLLLNILFIAVGLAGLLIGAHLLVKGAIFIAGRCGISEMAIGLTAVAFGTSIPEMATSVVSAFRKEAELCVGNIIGSNIFNILMVIGSVTLIRPLNVTQETLFFELPAMLLFSAVLIPMVMGTWAINRTKGFVLVFGYCAFVVLLFR
ncbi:MAG: sodium:calcium antiporter, partial [Planctomycetota bacterium]